MLIAYDRDEAGEAAAEALAAELTKRGIGAYRIQFPRGLDANAYAQKLQPAGRGLELLIGKAVWLGKGPAPALSPQRVAPAEEAPAAETASEERAAEAASEESVADPPAEELAPPSPAGEDEAPREPTGEAAAGLSAPPPGEPAPPLAAPPERAEAAPPAASEEPRPSKKPPGVEQRREEVVLRMGDRRWRVRGLAKNKSLEVLRVNVLVARGEAFHVDTFDLYLAKSRQQFAVQAAAELEMEERVVKADLGQVFQRLEALQEEQLSRELEPEKKTVEVSGTDRQEAMEFLLDPDMMDRILRDFDRCGVVGKRGPLARARSEVERSETERSHPVDVNAQRRRSIRCAPSSKVQPLHLPWAYMAGRGDLAEARRPLGGGDPVELGGGQELADGGGAGFRARGLSAR